MVDERRSTRIMRERRFGEEHRIRLSCGRISPCLPRALFFYVIQRSRVASCGTRAPFQFRSDSCRVFYHNKCKHLYTYTHDRSSLPDINYRLGYAFTSFDFLFVFFRVVSAPTSVLHYTRVGHPTDARRSTRTPAFGCASAIHRRRQKKKRKEKKYVPKN